MSKIVWCAEIGTNHKGSKSLACEMIRQAALAGATIAKFQLGHYDDLSEIQTMRAAPMKWAPELKKFCEYFGIEFMASIFSTAGLRMAQSVDQERYKFPSRVAFAAHSDENYDELLYEVLALGRETFVSDSKYASDQPHFRRLFCVAEYPTYPERVGVPYQFGPSLRCYGYSSHVHGFADALLAVARGAKYVEKHVTLDKTEELKDNSFALSFEEFSSMVKLGEAVYNIVRGERESLFSN